MALPTDRDGSPEVEREFAFSDREERLPWLESDDDGDELPGVDKGRILGFAALGVLFVMLAAGALWFVTRDARGGKVVADGSVIEAPDEPYRTRPENPGGRQVAGTGDTSFEVAEGREVEGRIAETGAPAPRIDRTLAADEPSEAAPAAGIGVQVGAYLSREAAEAGWSTLSGRLEPLHGRSHRVVEGVADSGTVFRLQVVAGGIEDAQALCSRIKAAGGDCQVKR
jgi:hypothetical protein